MTPFRQEVFSIGQLLRLVEQLMAGSKQHVAVVDLHVGHNCGALEKDANMVAARDTTRMPLPFWAVASFRRTRLRAKTMQPTRHSRIWLEGESEKVRVVYNDRQTTYSWRKRSIDIFCWYLHSFCEMLAVATGTGTWLVARLRRRLTTAYS